GSREGWAAVPVLLTLVTLWLSSQANGNLVILMRSAQMAMPYIFVGLSLLAFARRALLGVRIMSSAPYSRFLGRVAAAVVWVTIVGLNGFSIARTIGYMNRYSQETDPLVRHYRSDAPRWVEFRELLKGNQPAPVLLSGFNDFSKAHLIADGLRSTPHLLGKTITDYWVGIDPTYTVPKTHDQFKYRFRHWLTPPELVDRVRQDPVWDWPQSYAKLLALTRQAIVPLSGGYPLEWGEWPELWGPRAWRFPNLCDVLDRIETGFVTESRAPDGRDDLGPFWLPDRTLKASPRLQDKATAVIEVAYSGPIPRIIIDGVEASGRPRNAPASEKRILGVSVMVGPNSIIEVLAPTETRLRSIQLYRLLSSPLS